MKNKINPELLNWARAKHGRFAKIASACGASKRQVFALSAGGAGIAPHHHSKILALTGVCAVEKQGEN